MRTESCIKSKKALSLTASSGCVERVAPTEPVDCKAVQAENCMSTVTTQAAPTSIESLDQLPPTMNKCPNTGRIPTLVESTPVEKVDETMRPLGDGNTMSATITSDTFQSPLDRILMDQSRMFSRPQFTPWQNLKHSSTQPQYGKPVVSQCAISTLSLATPVYGTPRIPNTAQLDIGTGVGSVKQSDCTASGLNVTGPHDILMPSHPATPSSHQQHADKLPIDAVERHKRSEDPAEYCKMLNGNIAYSLWSLAGLKLIVRHHYHGYSNPDSTQPAYLTHLIAKLEHQLLHGVEQTTFSEAVRMWLALSLRHDTKLLRAHINALTSEVVMFDNMDKVAVDKLLTRLGFNPCLPLNVLHNVLDKLFKLDHGNYLLGHTPNSAHAQIKKTTNSERGVYDLHLISKNTQVLQNLSTSVPWIPIDTTILLPYYKTFHRIPCTFEPKDSSLVNTNPQLYKPAPLHGGSKKKKNKKKKSPVATSIND